MLKVTITYNHASRTEKVVSSVERIKFSQTKITCRTISGLVATFAWSDVADCRIEQMVN